MKRIASRIGTVLIPFFKFGQIRCSIGIIETGQKKELSFSKYSTNNYIKEYDCGISVEPENVSALKMGIQNMLSLSDEERKNMGCNGKKAVLENFQYGVLSKRFLNEMEQLRRTDRKK